jgi:hypothetical protein
VTHSGGKRWHPGILVEFSSADAVKKVVRNEDELLGSRPYKVWVPAGRNSEQDWASLTSLATQLKDLVARAGSRGQKIEGKSEKSDILLTYKRLYGKSLQPRDYSFPTLLLLIKSMPRVLRLQRSADGAYIVKPARERTGAEPHRRSEQPKMQSRPSHADRAAPSAKATPKPTPADHTADASVDETGASNAANDKPAKDKSWEQLNPKEQLAATALGWAKSSWDEGECPQQCNVEWSGLSAISQKMAKMLGYDEQLWVQPFLG